MIEMSRFEFPFEGILQTLQRVEQNHGVEPAGDGDDQLRAARQQPAFANDRGQSMQELVHAGK